MDTVIIACVQGLVARPQSLRATSRRDPDKQRDAIGEEEERHAGGADAPEAFPYKRSPSGRALDTAANNVLWNFSHRRTEGR